MQAARLPALRGWQWIVEAFRLYRRNPAALVFLVFGYWFALLLAALFPVIGQIVASLLVPPLQVSVMHGCRDIEAGRQPPVATLFAGFERNRNTLLLVGAAYLVATLAVVGLSTLIDGGKLLALLRAGKAEQPDALAAVQLPLVLMAPVALAFWFAPLLVAWHDCSLGKALFFSFVASLRNWQAFAAYGVGLAVVGVLAPFVVLTAAASLAPQLGGFIGALVGLPLLLVFVPTLFASFYVSYRDVFAPPVDERA